MENIETEKVIQDILLKELDLPQDYGQDDSGFIIPSVYVYAPNISLGTTDELQIGIQTIFSKVIANNTFMKEIDGKVTEVKECVVNDNIQIDIKSRNNDARIRRYEVLTALHSTYCQQMQEANNLKIFQIPNSFINLNMIEGSARIYRYSITVNVISKKQYTKEIDYYDKFSFNTMVDSKENEVNFKIPDENI